VDTVNLEGPPGPTDAEGDGDDQRGPAHPEEVLGPPDGDMILTPDAVEANIPWPPSDPGYRMVVGKLDRLRRRP
jgi:hypothetical protein